VAILLNCSEYESQLREALDELSSLKLINKLLQKEVLTYTTHQSSWESARVPNDSESIGDHMEYNGWTSVTEKSRSRVKDKSAKANQHIQITNHYTPLNDILNSNEGITAPPKNGIKKRVKNVSLKKTKGNDVTGNEIKKKKVIVIGDSHARGLAAELSASLGKDFEVMGTIMPGSRLSHITGLAKRETSQLKCDEFVIICGGANDINTNESKMGLRNIRKFALQNKHTNIITISPPHRHDLQDSSCINDEIQVYNRRLHKILKDMNHVTIVDTNYTREDFTRHGLHMNSAGKEKLTGTLGQVITNPSETQTSSISLNWKEASPATPNNEATVKSSTACDEVECKTAIRASNRTKKIPTTRNEDFLWPTQTLKIA